MNTAMRICLMNGNYATLQQNMNDNISNLSATCSIEETAVILTLSFAIGLVCFFIVGSFLER